MLTKNLTKRGMKMPINESETVKKIDEEPICEDCIYWDDVSETCDIDEEPDDNNECNYFV